MNIMRYTVAGLSLEIRRDQSMPSTVEEPQALKQFRTLPGIDTEPDVQLDWSSISEIPPMTEPCIYDPGQIWRLHSDGKGYIADIFYTLDVPIARLFMDKAWSRGTLIEADASLVEGSSVLGLGAGELLLRTRLVDCQGLVFHSSGIDDAGTGILFAGHAGAGKTTQALLWRQHEGVTVINDDRMAVRLADDGVMLHGFPWGGSANIAINHSLPLKAVVLLEQALETRLETLTPGTAMPLLIPRIFMPYWDEAAVGRALDTLEEILKRVPVFLLRNQADAESIDIVRNAL